MAKKRNIIRKGIGFIRKSLKKAFDIQDEKGDYDERDKKLRISHTVIPSEFIDRNKNPIWDEHLFKNKIKM